MTISIPNHIATANVAGAPVKYKWNNDIGLKLFASKDQNIRLYDAVDQADFRSKMGLGIAITEWIVWRLSGLADVLDALKRIEAAWATIARPGLAGGLQYTMNLDDDQEPVGGPLELALCNLGQLARRYEAGSVYLAEIVVKQAMLARHLLPDKKAFDAWLSEVLRAMAAKRPRTTAYDEDTGVYDFSQEAPVTRSFYSTDFQPSQDPARTQEEFLNSLDPMENPYLAERGAT
ncbi:MAG: hypothetical protein K0R53_2780 [Burkholderiales bacterium]|jgi:hypothetical protein|nr:hypothetical protein [Burkholderiales bacterium]